MQSSDVFGNLSPKNPIIQIEVHAEGLGHQPHGRIDAHWAHPLLYAGRLKIEDAGHFQDILGAHYQSMHYLL